jgi:hypothetical protein
MSSPRAAAKSVAKAARRPAASRKPATGKLKVVTIKAAAKPKAAPQNELSSEALRLAGEIERAFAQDEKALSVEALQALMGALCRVYSAQVENGERYTPIAAGQVVSPTGVMHTASGLLRAADLAVFELGMWQSWTGR